MSTTFIGKKFKGNRKLNDIIKDAKKLGFKVDQKEFNKGADGIWLRDLNNRFMQIYFNTFNGNFMVYTPASDKPKATHLSTEFDNEDWYNELLDLFYETADKQEE
jgi:hypothetical protein